MPPQQFYFPQTAGLEGKIKSLDKLAQLDAAATNNGAQTDVDVIAIGLGGAVGAIARYSLGLLFVGQTFPWGTLTPCCRLVYHRCPVESVWRTRLFAGVEDSYWWAY